MKKILFILLIVTTTTTGFSQPCLFEKTYNNSSIGYFVRSYPADVVALGNGWLIVGYQMDCSQAYAVYISCDGEVVWDYHAQAGYSTYTSLQKIDTLVYAAGVDLASDDVSGETQSGFVDVFTPSGFSYRILNDTHFAGGFASAFIDSINIVTTASTNDIASIGYSPPLQLPFSYINIYNRANLLPASNSVLVVGAKYAFLIDTTIIVVTHNQMKTYSISGQIGPQSAYTTIDSQMVAKSFNDSLIAVASRNEFKILRNNLQPIDSQNLANILDVIIDFEYADNEWVFLAKKGNQQLIARYSSSIGFIDSFHINIGCATATKLAAKDSTLLVAGYELIDENFSIFAKSFSYSGATVAPLGELSLLSASINIDSTRYSQTINIGTSPIVLYDAWITTQVTVVNNSSDTVTSFCIYSDVVDFMNCSRNYLNKCYNNITLASGDSILIDINYHDIIRSGYNISRSFWVVGVNQGLDKNYCNKLTALQTLFVGIDDVKTPEAITVYPNPFTGTVSFGNLPQGVTLGIYNLQGKEVALTQEVYADLSFLTSGIYIYRIVTTNGQLIKTGKLVKGY